MRWYETTGERLAPVTTPRRRAPSSCRSSGRSRRSSTLPQGRATSGSLSLASAIRAARAVHLPGEPVPLVARDCRCAHGEDRQSPSPDFRVLALLPAKPNSGVDDTRGVLGELLEADAGNGHLFASTIFARSGNRADPIYVHAKVAIIDDAWLTIGSANLNEHSLFNDTEMSIVSHDPGSRPRHSPAPLVGAP